MMHSRQLHKTFWPFLFIILLFIGNNIYSQVEGDRSGYTRHMVQPKETFYSISKKYGISIDQIKQANPGVEYPKAGDYLNIPGAKGIQEKQSAGFEIYTTREEVSIYTLARLLHYPIDSLETWNPGIGYIIAAGQEVKTRPPDNKVKFILHTVTDDRSSLKDVAGLYFVDYRDLRDVNPQIKNRVWFGQQIKIPLIEQGHDHFDKIEITGVVPEKVDNEIEEEETVSECPRTPVNRLNTYKVALMVPFSLEGVRNIDTDMKVSPTEMMNQPSLRFIQFYQGFLLAADSLTKAGLNLELSVFDVDQDISKAHELVYGHGLEDMDLIVGPFYKNTFAAISGFAREHSIPIINPLSGREDILSNNPMVYKVLPSTESLIDEFLQLVELRFRDYNTVIVSENKYQGANYLEKIRQSFFEKTGIDVPVVDYMTDSIAGVRQYLDTIGPNLVVVYAENEVLPVEIMPQLTELGKEINITLAGIPQWSKYEHLENKYLMALRTYIFSDSYIDYGEPGVKQFISRFRAYYLAEPMEYAYDGFDIAWFFLSALMDYGRDFESCVPYANYPLLHTRYRFRKVPEGGYDNSYWNVYHYQGYQLMQVMGLL